MNKKTQVADTTDDKLAVHGGTPVRTAPITARKPFGQEEEEHVLEALRSGSLFVASGTKVYAFLDRCKALFQAKAAVASTSGTAALHVA